MTRAATLLALVPLVACDNPLGCNQRSAEALVGINSFGQAVDGRDLYWREYGATCEHSGNTGGLRPMQVYTCTWCE